MTYRERLKELGACGEALRWTGGRDLPTAWAECERADWMLWLIARSVDEKKIDTRAVVRVAVSACRLIQDHIPPAAMPAVEIAERYANGETIDSGAAWAASAAARAALSDTAWAASAASAAASDALSHAAWAARAAAWAASAAARAAALKNLADIVRVNFPVPPVIGKLDTEGGAA